MNQASHFVQDLDVVAADVLCSITDKDLCFLHGNPLFHQHFGLTGDNLKGRPLFELVHPLRQDICVKAVTACERHPGKVVCIEVQADRSEAVSWYRWEIKAVTDENNQVTGMHFSGKDITNEKLAEQELWKQATLLDNISDGIISTDLNFCIKHWNRAAERYLGFRYEDVINRYYRDVFQMEAAEMTIDEIRGVIMAGKTWQGELRINCRGKDFCVYVQATLNAIKGPDGKLLGYIGVGRNITSEKTAHRELLLKQQQFASFMENTPSLAWINDEEGTLLYMNPLFQRTFNLPDDLIGKNVYDYYPGDMRKSCIESDQRVLADNKKVTTLEESADEQGNKIFYQVYKFPVESHSGKRLIGGLALDITEQLLTRNALMKSNELYENAGKATRDVIWDWDLQENKIRRIGGYKTIFGHDINDDLIEFNSANIHPDDAEIVVSSWQAALNGTNTRWQHEFRYRCADGSYKPVFDQACILRDEKGKAIRMIGSMQDISEERKLQAQVLETEIKKKQEVVAAVIDAQEKERREISNELHDNVNQLLAAAILFLKTSQKQGKTPNPLISQGLNYLQKAIGEIRNISHNLNPGALSVNGFVAALKDLTDRLSIPDRLSMQLTISKQFDENLLSANTKLTLFRMVQEEINNILKHSEADKVVISLEANKEVVELTVMDNGKGFDVTQSHKGLGIVNIYTRAENIGGKAVIRSSPGEGCTLTITIPLHAAD